MPLPQAAQSAAQRIRALPLEARLRVVARPHADPIAASAVLIAALRRSGRVFHLTFTDEHPPVLFESLRDDGYEAHVLLGLGGASRPLPGPLAGFYLLIDADETNAAPAQNVSSHVLSLPPPSVGAGDSSATTALAVAVALDDRNWDQAAVALAGAWSGRSPRSAQTDWNEEVLKESQRRGLVETRRQLRVPDGPIEDLIRQRIPPFDALADGGTDPESLCRSFELPPRATPYELGGPEAESLASLLVVRLLRAGRAAHDIREWFQDVPIVPAHDGLPIPRLASLLTAAGREQEPALAVTFLLGAPSVRADLERLEAASQEKIHAALLRIQMEEVRRLPGIHVLQIPDPAYTGAVASAAADRLLPPDRATLAYAVQAERVRASARAPASLAARGLNLAVALHRAATAHGGAGGGTPVAAGALVPLEGFEAFLRAAAELVSKQLEEE